jgi:prevent-host-death family protein
MVETLALATVKARLSELVERVASQQDRVVVTRNGRPAAVLISPEDLESLEETLAVLGDPDLLERVRTGHKEAERGEAVALEDLTAELAAVQRACERPLAAAGRTAGPP